MPTPVLTVPFSEYIQEALQTAKKGSGVGAARSKDRVACDTRGRS